MSAQRQCCCMAVVADCCRPGVVEGGHHERMTGLLPPAHPFTCGLACNAIGLTCGLGLWGLGWGLNLWGLGCGFRCGFACGLACGLA